MRGNDIDKGGWRGLLRRVGWMVAASLAVLHPAADASNALGMALDPDFGSNGFIAIPRYVTADPGTTITPIGMVRLKHDGGYIVATLQNVSNVPRMALSRFTAAGSLDTSWGQGGTQMPALPSPYLDAAPSSAIRLVAGEEGGQDIFYLAFSLQGSPSFSVAVAKFQANGSFDSSFGFGGYGVSSLPTSAPNGIGPLRGAAFTLVFGQPVLVVVVSAPGNRLVFSRAHGPGSAAMSDQGGGSVVTLGSSPTLLQMRNAGPNKVELVGGLGSLALYLRYDAGTLELHSRTFHFRCPAGTNWSVADALERPAAFGDDVLLVGRASCIGVGPVAVVTRMVNVADAPNEVWSARTETDTVCTTTSSPCLSVMLAFSESRPDVAVSVTPKGRLVPVRLADGKVLAGQPMNSFGGAYPQHSSYRGIIFRYPSLVGFGLDLPQVSGLVGLRVDGLFVDGFE